VPKAIVGLTAQITFFFGKRQKSVIAKIDTGAGQSSIDTNFATKMKLGPIICSKVIRSSHGTTLRAVVKAHIRFAGRRMRARFNIADRRHMRYKVLLGVNILKRLGVLVDPSRK
jgi:hypothetical protein